MGMGKVKSDCCGIERVERVRFAIVIDPRPYSLTIQASQRVITVLADPPYTAKEADDP